MSNEIINAYDQVITRLTDAAATGQPLAGVALLTNPATDEVIENANLPSIRAFMQDATRVNDSAMHRRAETTITMMLRLREDPQYGFYNSGKTRGLMWLLEKTMNAIDGSDLAGGGVWSVPPQCQIKDFVSNKTNLYYDLEVVLTTARYTRGGL